MEPLPTIGVIVCLYIIRREVMSLLRTFLTRRRLKKVIYVDSTLQCESIVNKYFLHHKVIGLDCEWVSYGSDRNPVSLLQIASPEGVCALFRMPKLYDFNYFTRTFCIPPSLEKLLDDVSIVKVGVAINNDATYLAEDYNVLMSSWLDLRHLAKENNILPRGLAYLAQATAGIVLEKKFSVRVGNWDAEILSDEQIWYAAMDAHAAVSIFTHFVSIKESFLSLLFFGLTNETYDAYMEQHNIKNLTEVPYKDKPQNTQSLAKLSKQNNRRNFSTYEFQQRFLETRQWIPESLQMNNSDVPWRGFKSGKVYDNCVLLDPRNVVLCTCERKKAQWYLDRNLGQLIKKKPLTVRLLFQPNQDFDPEDSRYYATVKKNQCVVCGSCDVHSLVKKYIVPHEYRKHLPDYMKSRRSHDVLLMCFRCHKRSNIKDQALRRTLAADCNAPFAEHDSKLKSDKEINQVIRKVKSAAFALHRHALNKQLPKHREAYLKEIIWEFYSEIGGIKNRSLNECVTHAVSTLQEIREIDNSTTHGARVVKWYQDANQLAEFETLWRRHFLITMDPQYLPQYWSLYHNQYE